MRITAGLHRGRALTAPTGKDTRPTSDRARESIFNILRHGSWHAGVLTDAAVLDVFAGTGALGLEALSQGAAHAVFIEREYPALMACRSNIEALGEQDRTAVFTFDAVNPIPRPLYLAPRTLVFLDPPYGKYLCAEALKALIDKDWLAPGAACVLEMSKKIPEIIPAGFTLRDTRVYGLAQVQFVTWEG